MSGRIDASGRIQIGAVTPGIVVEVGVEQGQQVAKGAALLRFDDRAESAAVAQARATLAQARARLVEVRQVTHALAVQEQKQAEIEVLQSARANQRSERLAASGGISVVDAEQADVAARLAESRRDAATVRVTSSSEGGAEVLLALAQVQAAEANVKQADAQLEQRRVVALVDAQVLERNVEPGDAVQPGRTLLVLARGGTAKIKVQPDEKTLAVLRLGQRAAVSADAYPDARFEAVVGKISPGVDTSRGTIDVELFVENAPAFLRTDMTVSVEIVVGTKTGALVVPVDAVRDLATKSPWVLVVGPDDATAKRPITLGARAEGWVEVVAGLVEGDRVVVGDPALAPGDRVKGS